MARNQECRGVIRVSYSRFSEGIVITTDAEARGESKPPVRFRFEHDCDYRQALKLLIAEFVGLLESHTAHETEVKLKERLTGNVRTNEN
jgi:hypothetical protein